MGLAVSVANLGTSNLETLKTTVIPTCPRHSHMSLSFPRRRAVYRDGNDRRLRLSAEGRESHRDSSETRQSTLKIQLGD